MRSAHALAVMDADKSEAVVLDLVDPLRPARHGVGVGRQAGLDEAGRVQRHSGIVAWRSGGSPDRLRVGGAMSWRIASCHGAARRYRSGGVAPPVPHASIIPMAKQLHEPGPPMTLGNMRANGVHHLIAYCLNDACRHSALIDVSGYPDSIEVQSWRAKCGKCGARGNRIDVRPNWKERSATVADWSGRPAMPGGEN